MKLLKAYRAKIGILHLSVYTLKSGSLSGSLSLSRANCFDPDSDPDPDPDLENVNHFPGFMKDAQKSYNYFHIMDQFVQLNIVTSSVYHTIVVKVSIYRVFCNTHDFKPGLSFHFELGLKRFQPAQVALKVDKLEFFPLYNVPSICDRRSTFV